MSVVRVPPVLRAEAGGAREVEATGSNVRELLEDLSARIPALGSRVYDDGEIQPFVNVYVDGEDVRTRDGLDTPVRDSSTVILLPAMAGGSLAPLTDGRSRAAEPPSAPASPRWPHRAFRGRVR
jgi:molybdopterin converting factor small subunit